jgi:DNA-binding transcriptional regulator YiaG
MPKTRNINEVIDQALADPKRRANIDRHRQETIAEMLAHSLAELRKAREVTQVELALALGRGQSSVSGLEHSEDPKLSSLREYVEALGGRLEVAAVFEEQRIPLEV